MTPFHRTVLLEAQYALDHVVWSYRSELDRTPTKNLTADDVCLADFAFRTGALVRNVLDADNQHRAPRLAFHPPSVSADRRLAEVIQARRRASAAKASAVPEVAVPSAPPSDDIDDRDASPNHDDEVLMPDAVSPSRMPRRRF